MVMMLYFDVASSDMDRVAEKKMNPVMYRYPIHIHIPIPIPIPYTAYRKGSLYITEGGIDAGTQKPSGAVETSL